MVIIRSFGSQFQFNLLLSLAVIAGFTFAALIVSSRLLRMRRV